MKKMLIMAMAVFALVACKKSSSDTGLPQKEAKALEASTSGAVDLLNDSPEQVDAAMTKAGYKEIKGGYNPFENMDMAPARIAKKVKTANSESDYDYTVSYQLGLPDNWETMTEEQAIAWANNAIADGNAVILVTAQFNSKKLQAMATMFVIKKSDKANKTFTATSEDLYDKLPSGKNNHAWEGAIYNIKAGEPTGMTNYSDHSKFVSKVAKAEGIEAAEYGYAISKGWLFANVWLNPDASMEKEMMEEGLTTPICYGAYEVAYGSALKGYYED